MWLIALLFVFVSLLQLLYWLVVFRGAWKLKSLPVKPVEVPAVSIIVCARNEAENLREHLPFLLEQSVFLYFRRPGLAIADWRHRCRHPPTSAGPGPLPATDSTILTGSHSELIIVDDGSTDETAAVVRSFQADYPFLRLIQPTSPTRPGKKDALTVGIAAARNEFLLLTDADCKPASKNWAALMAAPLSEKAEVVLGYSPYLSEHSLLNRWQRLETSYTALQYLGFAQRGYPYMGVGRNLAYRKSFFNQAGGLAAHAHLPGGDDDLLISQYARDKSTEVRIQNPAWTWSKPAQSWKEYWLRKRRHLSVGSHYPSQIKWLLGGLALSHGLHYLLGFILLFSGYWTVAITGYVLRILAVLFVWKKGSNIKVKLKVPQSYIEGSNLYVDYILFDAGLCFYYSFNVWVTLLAAPTKRWS